MSYFLAALFGLFSGLMINTLFYRFISPLIIRYYGIIPNHVKTVSYVNTSIVLFCSLAFVLIITLSNAFPLTLSILLITLCLLILTLTDIYYYLLPDIFTLFIAIIGIIMSHLNYTALTLSASAINFVYGYLLLFIPATLFKIIRGYNGLGGGDIKLMAGLSTWLPLPALPIVIIIASLSALIVMFITQTTNTKIAFGPFLAFAGWLALLKNLFIIHL